ncbi:MAG: hypothetical protein PVG71_12295 [Anaerolineae bacterium]|jgi:hypothetical protein
MTLRQAQGAAANIAADLQGAQINDSISFTSATWHRQDGYPA